MQISSGWAKGMRLAAPAGEETRPTSAKVRAATLNILAPYLENALFLDLFAGSGAMGIEAVSRGARGATFIERAKPALGCLKQNLTEVERRALAQDIEVPSFIVVPFDVLVGLKRVGRGPYDVIFADPPYRLAGELMPKLLELAAPLIAAEGVLAVETAAEESPAWATAPGWEVLKQRAYGDTMITILGVLGGIDGGI